LKKERKKKLGLRGFGFVTKAAITCPIKTGQFNRALSFLTEFGTTVIFGSPGRKDKGATLI